MRQLPRLFLYPDVPAHHIPTQPLREEAYPLQAEIEQQHRILHTHIFTEVISPHQTGASRLMVTEVDRSGVKTKPSTGVLLNGNCWSHSCRPLWVDKLLGTIYPTCQLLASSLQLFQKCTMSTTLGNITRKRLTMLINWKKAKNQYRDQGWTTLTPSPPMSVRHRFQVRSTSWPQSSGTFSTMTGTPMLRSLRSLKIQETT